MSSLLEPRELGRWVFANRQDQPVGTVYTFQSSLDAERPTAVPDTLLNCHQVAAVPLYAHCGYRD
jgi:hypothetical protein